MLIEMSKGRGSPKNWKAKYRGPFFRGSFYNTNSGAKLKLKLIAREWGWWVNMSSTLLEVTRASHEEVERLERLIVKELQNEPASGKDRLLQSHRVRNMIDTIMSTTDKLVLSSLYTPYFLWFLTAGVQYLST